MIKLIETLSKLISEYGPTVVLGSVFIAVVILIIQRINKNMEQLQQQIAKANKTYEDNMIDLSNRLVDQFINISNNKESSEKHTEKDLLNTFVKLQSALKNDCTNTMDKVKSARLAIYLFHNGTHSTHGINFFKVSCICEKVLIGSGIRERSIEHSNIPINLFDHMIDELISNNIFVINNNDDLDNSNHRIFISSKKIKYSVLIPIFDPNNNLLGFVLSEFDNELTTDILTEQSKELNILVNKIVPTLSCLDYIETNIDKFNEQHE